MTLLFLIIVGPVLVLNRRCDYLTLCGCRFIVLFTFSKPLLPNTYCRCQPSSDDAPGSATRGRTPMGDKDLYDDVSATRILTVRDIIFDFEGTLVDFQWQLVPAVEECLAALADAGFKRHWYGSNPTYASIYNQTLSLSQAGKGQADPHLDMAIIDAIYDMYDADALTRWHLYSDTLETLATLKGMGFQMGLVSNGEAKPCDPLLID